MDWSVILPLWYFELYCELYSTHFLKLKDGDMLTMKDFNTSNDFGGV